MTFCAFPRYIAPMVTRSLFPKKFTREQVEWRMDELAIEFQRTRDMRVIRKISALNRLLARMAAPDTKRKNYQ